MKKMLVCAAALSFALAACADDCCGDESSSGANGRKINRHETLHVGDCDESFSHCPRSTGAFMLQGEDGGYQVLLDGIQITSIEIDGDYWECNSFGEYFETIFCRCIHRHAVPWKTVGGMRS